jgi:hypothetical protein
MSRAFVAASEWADGRQLSPVTSSTSFLSPRAGWIGSNSTNVLISPAGNLDAVVTG